LINYERAYWVQCTQLQKLRASLGEAILMRRVQLLSNKIDWKEDVTLKRWTRNLNETGENNVPLRSMRPADE
jgi:hypothetical protein